MADQLARYAILPLVGWASGINVYLTTAILGIGARAGWLELPAGLDPLKNPLVIALAVILYAVEFVADKVPYVDSLWDSFHTFIRPAAAGTMGYMAANQGGVLAGTVLALLTGSIALDTHAVKATTRLAINTSPEPVSNIAASIAEHSFVVFILWFFAKHPILAVLIVLALFIASFVVIRFLWRVALAVLRAIFRREKPAAYSELKSPQKT